MRILPLTVGLIAAAALACTRDVATPLQANIVANGHVAFDRRDDDNGGHDNGNDATSFERFSVGGIDRQFDWKSLGGAGAPAPNPGETHCAVYDHVIADNGPLDAPRDFGKRSP